MQTNSPDTIQKFEIFASNLRRHADSVDAYADKVQAWGRSDRKPSLALGLVEQGQELQDAARRFYENDLMGRNTKASWRNEASIALGGIGLRGGGMGRKFMYALYMDEKYGAGTALGKMDVEASSLRVHAASCRVVAELADGVVSGTHRYIG